MAFYCLILLRCLCLTHYFTFDLWSKVESFFSIEPTNLPVVVFPAVEGLLVDLDLKTSWTRETSSNWWSLNTIGSSVCHYLFIFLPLHLPYLIFFKIRSKQYFQIEDQIISMIIYMLTALTQSKYVLANFNNYSGFRLENQSATINHV